ncbi:UDP-N-acetylglucosamine 2-epimerase [Marinomonas algicola]|uniref:UDP-N-acetylglucosamine 2-epimerase n=1 Tax=Marinomonas algicola TaxID=2773454 RepID=UPI001748D5A9|nr:UDP-N-acetylglucosamine 2-epimerase [Marinomonas algicola]
MKKIGIVTTNRSEFGLLYWLIHQLMIDKSFEVQLIVAGSHLCENQGYTLTEIEQSGFPVSAMLPYLTDENAADPADQLSKFSKLLSVSLPSLSPDLLIVLGDRYELLSVASTALMLDIPIAHLSGGELTEGALDDAVRHAVTKLSYWHFVANESFRTRVIQMGESPDRVFNVGELGLEHSRRTEIIDYDVLTQKMWAENSKPFLLVTYHPETWSKKDVLAQQKAVLTALESVLDTHNLLITYPNCDKDYQALIDHLKSFQKQHIGRVFLSASLGFQRYISALTYADLVVGNSSSGLYEAPAYQCLTINVGDRQKGRMQGATVFDVPCVTTDIIAKIAEVLTLPKDNINWHNPYGDGFVVDKIMSILKNDSIFPDSCRKTFYNLPTL